MSSTLPRMPEDEFEKDRERREAQRKRESMRRKKEREKDPVQELRRLRNARRRRLEDEDYIEDEDLELGDECDCDYPDGDDFRKRIERGRDFFNHDD